MDTEIAQNGDLIPDEKMATEEESEVNFMAHGSPSATIKLHPLVILNISDHCTRVRAQGGDVAKVIGALIGKQEGRLIEVMNSFELLIDEADGTMNKAYYYTKEEQLKQVFPEMEFLGWYSSGDGLPNKSDVANHRLACSINESPIFLKINPDLDVSNVSPISIYESVIDIVNNEATLLFLKVPYSMNTGEAERIGVDHVTRMSAGEPNTSSVSEHLLAEYNSVKMLHSRIKLLRDYIVSVEKCETVANHDIIRGMASLLHKIPGVKGFSFDIDKEYYQQSNDVVLIRYLGLVTKCTDAMNQYINKFYVLQEPRYTMPRRGKHSDAKSFFNNSSGG